MSNTVRGMRRARSKKTTDELEQSIAEVFNASKASFVEIGRIMDERTNDLNNRLVAALARIDALERAKAPESGIIVPRLKLS